MSKSIIISAILLATILACLHGHQQQHNKLLAAHKDMIAMHKERIATLAETHQQHTKLLSLLTRNMAPHARTEDYDEDENAPGKALLNTTLPSGS